MASRIKVYFVYRRSSRYLGSTVLRADQLCRIATRYLSDRYEFATLPIPGMRYGWQRALWVMRRPEAVYIFVKDAIDRMDPAALAALHRKAIAIGVDYIDRDLQNFRADSIDLHLSSSFAGEAALRSLLEASDRSDKPAGARTAVLLHNTDTRLDSLHFASLRRARVVYFGGAVNAAMTEYARSVVDVVAGGLAAEMAANFRRLEEYNAHYGVRPQPIPEDKRQVFTPFTKGFTAAVCGSPILTNRGVVDAVRFLGGDYPFLIDSADPMQIDQGLKRMIEAYGTKEWEHGLAVMADLRERVSPARLARDLGAILDGISQ